MKKLKNDGVLPLAANQTVAVFGRCQLDWFYVGSIQNLAALVFHKYCIIPILTRLQGYDSIIEDIAVLSNEELPDIETLYEIDYAALEGDIFTAQIVKGVRAI